MIWSNVRRTTPGVAIRGPRLEFRPFTLDHHQQYKCLIKSQRTKEILRTVTFDTYANIHEKIDRKPKLNLTMDTSRLFPQGELRLICSGGKSNVHSIVFDLFRLFQILSINIINGHSTIKFLDRKSTTIFRSMIIHLL